MLALASLLEQLADDPGTLGKRYALTADPDPSRLPAVRRLPGVADVAPRYECRRRLLPPRGEPADHRLPRRPHPLRGAAAGAGGGCAPTARWRSGSGWPRRSDCAPARRSPRSCRHGRGRPPPRRRGGSRAREGRPSGLRARRAAARRRSRPRADPGHPPRPREPTGRGSPPAWPRSARGPRATAAPRPQRPVPRPPGHGAARRRAGINGLVCLYALVQSLAMTAVERRGTVALLRACGGGPGHVGLLLAGAAACRAAALAAPVLERFVLSPAVGGLAADYATLPLGADRARSRSSGSAWSRWPRRPPRSSPAGPGASRSSPACGRAERWPRGRGRARPAGVRRAAARRGLSRSSWPRALAVGWCGPAAGQGATARDRLDPRLDLDRSRRRRRARARTRRAAARPRRPRPGAAPGRPPLATFAQITDAHVRDEESPGRLPVLDRLGPPFVDAFRPQEALSAQVLAGTVAAVNRLEPDAVAVTGDLVDTAQANELEQAIAVLRGGRVDPDSGRRGYDGPQAATNPDPFFYRPGCRRAAAPRAGRGRPAPLPLARPRRAVVPGGGNHDVLTSGVVAPSERIAAAATGSQRIAELDEDLERPARRRASRRSWSTACWARAWAGPFARRPTRSGSRSTRARASPGCAGRAARGAPGRGSTTPSTSRRGARPGPRRRPPRRLGRPRSVPRSPGYAASCPRRRDRTRRLLSPSAAASAGGEAALRLLDADPRVVAAVSGHRTATASTHPPAQGCGWSRPPRSPTSPSRRAPSACASRRGGVVLETWMIDHTGGRLAGVPAASSPTSTPRAGGRVGSRPARRSQRAPLAPGAVGQISSSSVRTSPFMSPFVSPRRPQTPL